MRKRMGRKGATLPDLRRSASLQRSLVTRWCNSVQHIVLMDEVLAVWGFAELEMCTLQYVETAQKQRTPYYGLL